MRKASMTALALVGTLLWPAAASAQEIPAPPLSKRAGKPAAPVRDPDSVKDLKRAIARDPSNAEAWATLAWRCYRDGRYGEARWLIGEARRLQPQDLYVLWLSGLAAYRMREYGQAKTFLWDLYDKQRQWPATIEKDVAWDILGRLFLEEDKLFEAAIFFSKAAEYSPNTWQYHFLLGFTEWYRQRYGDAFESLDAAVKLNSGDPMVLRYYAFAKAAYDERWGTGSGRVRMAGAIEAAKRSIAASPGDADGYELLGTILGGIGERTEAIQYLRKAIALDPNTAAPRFALASLLLRDPSGSEAAEAERLLVEAIAISPDFWRGRESAPHVKMLAAILINSGREGAAHALLQWSRQEGSR